MATLIRLVIALTFFFVTGHASAVPLPAKPDTAGNETLVVRAQGFRIEFGVSDGMILSVLSANGYSAIKITKKQLTKARAEACKGGTRFDVEIGFDGRIRRAKPIGTCRPVISLDIARNILRQKGFRQIQLGPDGAGFVATACRGNRRIRVLLDQYGDMRGEKIIGRCGGVLTKYDIAALLRAQGYSRVRAERAHRGNFRVEACRRDDKVTLLIGNDGVILREQRTGRCEPPIHPAVIPAILTRFGFTRIDIIDRQLPRYVAHACRAAQRVEISMNRYGEITGERSIGICELPLSAASLERKLREIGYDTVKIVKGRASGFVAEVCEDGARFRLELTVYGETISEKRLGNCPSRRVRTILKQVEKNGVTGATMYVIGCRNKKKVRIELDQYGSIAGRKVIGRCR